jgi:chemotaxis protein CheD
MNQVVVGIADCRVSSKTENIIVAHALGSCIAVAIYDPVSKVAGMLHFMLPDSNLDQEKAEQNPNMFADTGIPLLFRAACGMGADKRRIEVYLAGGAHVMGEVGVFNIGKRNTLAARETLWRAGLSIHGEAVGGMVSRTARLEVASGALRVRDCTGAEQRLDLDAMRACDCAASRRGF